MKYNFTHEAAVKQGSTWSFHIQITDSDNLPIDLSQSSARMHVRSTISSETILIELTTENGMLSFGQTPSDGNIYGEVPADTTTLFAWTSGVYDLEVQTGSVVHRFLEGNIEVTPEVTR